MQYSSSACRLTLHNECSVTETASQRAFIPNLATSSDCYLSPGKYTRTRENHIETTISGDTLSVILIMSYVFSWFFAAINKEAVKIPGSNAHTHIQAVFVTCLFKVRHQISHTRAYTLVHLAAYTHRHTLGIAPCCTNTPLATRDIYEKKYTLNPGRQTPKSEDVLVSKQPRVHECSQPHHQSLSNYSHAPSLWHKSALISTRCRIREYQLQHLLHPQTQPLKAQQSGSAGINKGRRGTGRRDGG